MADKLKPCPFCENPDVQISWESYHPLSCTWDYRYYISCFGCGLRIRPIEDYHSKEWLIKMWNTRSFLVKTTNE